MDNISSVDTKIANPVHFPLGEQQGFGFHEAPRGMLSHGVVIRDGKIANYQCVVPSTWKAGPHDGQDQMGPHKASLIGNPVANVKLPLEVLRTVRPFDPCLACVIHTVSLEGHEPACVRDAM